MPGQVVRTAGVDSTGQFGNAMWYAVVAFTLVAGDSGAIDLAGRGMPEFAVVAGLNRTGSGGGVQGHLRADIDYVARTVRVQSSDAGDTSLGFVWIVY